MGCGLWRILWAHGAWAHAAPGMGRWPCMGHGCIAPLDVAPVAPVALADLHTSWHFAAVSYNDGNARNHTRTHTQHNAQAAGNGTEGLTGA